MRTANSAKPRKPYKITKPRERWTEQEHVKFLEAIDKFGRDWKQIVSYIGTRSVSQVRSHAQKHFIRLEKKGLGDVVPPARRKARWADKRSAGMCDNFSESDQDFSALHQQTSSSSVSTREHQAMLAAGQSLEGFGSSTDYSDCQPLISRTHSLGSLASRNTSFTSPASQTEFITYAQEMLLHRQDASTPSASTGHAPPCSSQQLQPEQRQFVLELLQQLAAQQQAEGLSSATLMDSDRPPSQQQLKQLQQQYPQQRALQQQALQGPHLSADHPPVAAHTDTWPWRAPAPAPATGSAVAPTSTAVLTHDYSSMTSSPSTSMTDYPSASSYQPAAPQLDGAFLAECFKSPGLAAAAHKLAWQNLPNQTLHSQNMLKQNLLRQGLPCQNSPNASMASSRHCFTSSSSPPASSGSCMPALQPEALHHSPMHPTEVSPLGDTLGLEDIDFWDDVGGSDGLEDPLMQAVEAAMGCTDESEISCFHMATPEV